MEITVIKHIKTTEKELENLFMSILQQIDYRDKSPWEITSIMMAELKKRGNG